jgi:hypothetical protein
MLQNGATDRVVGGNLRFKAFTTKDTTSHEVEFRRVSLVILCVLGG